MNNEFYKSTYTKEEAEELASWIERVHPDGEMDLGSGVIIKDLNQFCEQIRHIIKEEYANTIFSGQICLMMKVRERYIQDHS